MEAATGPSVWGLRGGERRLGDRLFSGAAIASGIAILTVLAGVAIFLLIQAVPALSASTDELAEGKGLVEYIAPLAFGTVLAATLEVPANPALTPSGSYRIIGTPAARPDLPSKTNGSAKYGLDAVVPGMAFAIVKHCPTMGGTLKNTPSVPPGASAVDTPPSSWRRSRS